MHLAGKADTGNLAGTQIGDGEDFANSEARSAPPVLRVLFGPTDLWRSEGLVFFCGRGADAAIMVDEQSSCAAGADVDAEKVLGHGLVQGLSIRLIISNLRTKRMERRPEFA